MFKFLRKISKTLAGGALFVLSGIAGAKGWVDPDTAEMGKAIGGGIVIGGVWHGNRKVRKQTEAIAKATGAPVTDKPGPGVVTKLKQAVAPRKKK